MGKYDKKSVSSRGANPAPRKPQPAPQASKPSPPANIQDNPELQEIAQWLSKVKFRQKAVGGLDPADVWKKIEELNSLYEKALSAERVRCNLLIRQLRLNAQIEASEEYNGQE